jgi:hypothetical protein
LDFGFGEGFETRALQKSRDRGLWGADARPFLFIPPIWLARRKAANMQGKPSRRGKTCRALRPKATLAQSLQHKAAEVFGRPDLHAGRDFLGK